MLHYSACAVYMYITYPGRPRPLRTQPDAGAVAAPEVGDEELAVLVSCYRLLVVVFSSLISCMYD